MLKLILSLTMFTFLGFGVMQYIHAGSNCHYLCWAEFEANEVQCNLISDPILYEACMSSAENQHGDCVSRCAPRFPPSSTCEDQCFAEYDATEIQCSLNQDPVAYEACMTVAENDFMDCVNSCP